MAFDNSVLSADQQANTPFPLGSPSAGPVSPADAAVAAAPIAAPAPPAPPAEAMTPAMSAPDVTPGINPTVAPAAPPAPGPAKPGLWAGILQGALVGLAGSAGAKHFGGGLAMGAEGFEKNEQLQKENTVQQQMLKMESVKAADSHILALQQAKLADVQTQEAQQSLDEQHLIYQQTMKALGIEPTGSVTGATPNEIHSDANGMLNTLAQRNGGTIPAVATTNSPTGVGSNEGKHEINVYTTNSSDIQKNPNGNRALVDEVSRIQNGSPMPDQQWTSGNGAMLGKIPNPVGGQVAMVQDAKKFLIPQLPSKDSAENDATAASNHQQLDAYKKAIGDTPTPQQTAILKALQAKTDTFDKTVAGLTQKTAADQAAAAGQKAGAEAAAKETYEEKERIFASQQQQKMMEAMKNLTFGQESIKDSTKAWTDQQHGYLQANANFNMVDNAINQAKDGNGLTTSFVPAMEALGVSVAQGSHRVSPADAAAAGAPGGWAERFNAWADKAASGKLSPQLVQEGHTLINDLRQSKYAQAISQSRIDAASGRLPASQVPVFDPKGNLTTLDKAPTHTVMGSDKKLHYTNDLHQDLGVVQ